MVVKVYSLKSIVDSRYKLLTIDFFYLARAEGFEPPSAVLETDILPLHYARFY